MCLFVCLFVLAHIPTGSFNEIPSPRRPRTLPEFCNFISHGEDVSKRSLYRVLDAEVPITATELEIGRTVRTTVTSTRLRFIIVLINGVFMMLCIY